MKWSWTLLLAALALPACWLTSARAADDAAKADAPQAKPGTQTAEHFEKPIPAKLDYLLYLPEDYGKDKSKKFPLIVFLHGSGERGTDLNKVKVHGPPKLLDQKKDTLLRQFIVVSPQCPPDQWWKPFELDAMLGDVLGKYEIDQDRVYLTGLSMGGFGTWDWAEQNPNRFAAIAPVCGGGNEQRLRFARKLPAWVFHGEQDHVVPVANSDKMVAALKALNAEVKYTRYPTLDHDCWTATYDNEDLYKWFLDHRRGSATK